MAPPLTPIGGFIVLGIVLDAIDAIPFQDAPLYPVLREVNDLRGSDRLVVRRFFRQSIFLLVTL
jgi:hypothetical protein